MEHFLDELTNAPIRFDVGTNGTLLDDAWIRKLKQTNRCTAITLSLDGFKDYHDSIRGNGTFEAVLNAIHKLCDAKIKTSVNVVVSQDNYTTMPDFAQFLESLPITAYTLYTRADQAHGENALGGELSITELAHFIQIMNNLNLRKIDKNSTNLKLLDSLRNPPKSPMKVRSALRRKQPSASSPTVTFLSAPATTMLKSQDTSRPNLLPRLGIMTSRAISSNNRSRENHSQAKIALIAPIGNSAENHAQNSKNAALQTRTRIGTEFD